MILDLALRFIFGGLIVALFSFIADVFKPKTFSGLFGAAPSVALVTLALTAIKEGSGTVGLEARSMVLGAIALFTYSLANAALLSIRIHAWLAAGVLWLEWFAVAFGLWWLLLR